jgi:hypothetical protein
LIGLGGLIGHASHMSVRHKGKCIILD